MDLSVFEGSSILVTGASGLIGKAIINKLLSHGGAKPVKIYALVRDIEKAEKAFKDLHGRISFIVCDVRNLQPRDLGVNYIIHAASKTASRQFISEPVEVIETAFYGTRAVLEFARVNPVKGLVYLSSMEVYGAPETEEKIEENSATDIDCMQVRSSYPESKRLCENMCASYYSEYGVPAKVVRLTQTFGEGVDYNDGRVFAEFARCAIEGKDIVLKTKGETKRNYIDVRDAAEAVLTVLVHGIAGQAYNAANEDSYCSIYEMAQMVARKFGNGKVAVRIEDNGEAEKLGYAKTLKMNLSAAKLRALGWKPTFGLEQSYADMIDYMKANKGN